MKTNNSRCQSLSVFRTLTLCRSLALTLLLCVVLSGCGPSLIKPRGRVIKGGAPLTMEKTEKLGIALYSMTDGVTSPTDARIASVKRQDTAFTVLGRQGKGIPPGQYRITVALMRGASERDLWNGKYDKAKSPFVFDLTSDKEEIVIDLGKD